MPIKIDIQENILLAPFTTFKIGGPAKFFVEVAAEEELLEALNYAKENNLEIFVLGGGSNILVSDEGFSGLVIRIQATSYKIQDTNLECGAGLLLSEAVRLARENSLSGLEWAAGIPGAVGGAVRGNAGAYGSEIKNSVEGVKVLEISKIQKTITKQIPNSKFQIPNPPAGEAGKFQISNYKLQNCDFSYRNSIFKQNKNLIVLSCVLNLQKGDKNEIEGKIREVIRKRTAKIPKESSPGSFFQNPTVSDSDLIKRFEHDTNCQCRDNKIPAGWLIDELGLRGKRIGDIMVSEKHGNFVINLGAGKAQDVVMLSSLIKMKVRDEFGVQLKEEIQYVGF
ncbi:MAG: FAD-binding protein [Parcubacteria group bacterium]